MRFWIVLMTMCSLLSLPFSGSMAADSVHHASMMQSASEHEQHMSAGSSDDAEHCPMTSPAPVEIVHDCCDENVSGTACGSCPPDCGHCVMSDHGSSAALTMQQTHSHAAFTFSVVGKSSFYQLLSGQPTPPPIIS